MKRLGLLIRIDAHSGLAHQTQEAYRWLRPDATLAIVMAPHARNRGPEWQHLLPEVPRLIPVNAAAGLSGQTDVALIDSFLDQIDVLFAVETFMDPYLATRAAERGIVRILYANPELLSADDVCEQADHYLYAAPWGEPFPKPGFVLPWPTSPDEMADVAARRRAHTRPVPTFVHPTGDAFLDRNGTDVVLDAAVHITVPARIIVFGERRGRQDWNNERVTLEWRPRVDDYRDLYAEADCLLLPRRYGALSLPMLEAAAAGIPTITTDLLPQNGWFAAWPELLIPAGQPQHFPMKGNMGFGVGVFFPSGSDLAAAIDKVADRDRLAALGSEVGAWAEERAWPAMLEQWNGALR